MKLSQFLQYLPKHALQSSSCFTTLKDQQSGLDMERPFTQEGNYLVKVISFQGKYENLSDFMLLQTFNLSTFSNVELDKFESKIPESKKGFISTGVGSYKHIDENYSFVIPNWLLIIITVLGTTVLVILVSVIWYIKYCKATDKVRYFLTYLRGKIGTLT